MLLSPFKWLGFNVERFTARLLLTLEYVEELAVKDNYRLSFHQLGDIHLATENLQNEKVIVLQRMPFNMIDKMMIVLFTISTLVLIALKFLTAVEFMTVIDVLS
jgi:energy-coupling factor transport system permease protein